MSKAKVIITGALLASILVVCYSNKGPRTPSENWSTDVSHDAFIEFINQIDSATNIANEEEVFFENVNSEVKIKGTNCILLVSREYLNMSPANLPETLAIQWFTKRKNSNKNSFISSLIRWFTRRNSDILFEGKDIHIEKSLIADIKAAIASASKEITQPVLDAKTTSENFAFALTFHYSDNGYWRPSAEKNEHKFNEQRAARVRGTEDDYLFAFRNDLKAELTNLPDKVQIIQSRIKGVPDKFQAALSLRKHLRSRTRNILSQLQADVEFLMVPKSVIKTMKTPLIQRMRGIKRDHKTWLPLVSINITFETYPKKI